MSIKKIIEAKENTKTVVKSIRLTEKSAKTLEKLALKGETSQNEIINILLEENNNDLQILNEIEAFMKRDKGEVLLLTKKIKTISEVLFLTYWVSKKEGRLTCKILIDKRIQVNADETRYETFYENVLPISKISELLELGVDSSYEVLVK